MTSYNIDIAIQKHLAMFWSSPGKVEEIDVNSKYFFYLFICGKFVIENQILFAKEAELYVLKNISDSDKR